MSERKIAVPDGMLTAAEQALSVDQDQFRRWLKGDVGVPCPGANGYPLLLMLRAALRWLAENPIAPTLEQWGECVQNSKLGFASGKMGAVAEWQRRMFLAPEPETSKAINDWLYINGIRVGCDGKPEDALPLIDESKRGQRKVAKGDEINGEIVVPDGMVKAAETAYWDNIHQPREFPRYLLEAALRWLTKNPIAPTDSQATALWKIGLELSPDRNETTDAAKNLVLAWGRIQFLAPEPPQVIDAEKERFRAALEKLARLGNGPRWGNSEGNEIAQEALLGKSHAPGPKAGRGDG